MIVVPIDYASPSALDSGRDRTVLGLSANGRRPVRFHGRVTRRAFLLRFALRALGEAIWSDDSWMSREDWLATVLDPVITVHPDRIFFEAFSQDESVYAALHCDPALFETEGEVRHGTTNVDFSAWLWGALGEMRTSRETWFRVDARGFEVATAGFGGRSEEKVELPENWVRGFLELQGAMAFPGTRLRVRAVDLLSAIRFLRYTKAKVSPRALRYEMEPGRDARIVLEPWEHAVPLVGCDHGYPERRVVRTWGRRRLALIEGLLPFADEVEIYLKGRSLPHFYAVKMPGMTFLLGLSGWTGRRWSESGFELLGEVGGEDPALLEGALERLIARRTLTAERLAEESGAAKPEALRALARWCRRGRAIYDLERREFRHRELFEQPVDEAKVFPPDPRRERARRFVREGAVRVETCGPEEARKVRHFRDPVTGERVTREVVHRDWRVTGSVADAARVEIVLGDEGRILFGTCTCEHFKEHVLNLGPCAHMAALFEASADRRVDLPTSAPATPGQAVPRAPSTRRPRGDEGEEDSVDAKDETGEKDE